MSNRFNAVVLRVVVGFAVVAALGIGVAEAQYGHGSIVGWGYQVFGADLSRDLVAVAGGGVHSLGLKGYARVRGDLNCDGAIDGFDIDPFILVLLKAEANEG